MPYFGSDGVALRNVYHFSISSIGGSNLVTRNNCVLSLENLLHTPEALHILLSVQQLCQDNNIFIEFHPCFFLVKDQNLKNVLLRGSSEGGLYKLKGSVDCKVQSNSQSVKQASHATKCASSRFWQ